MYIIGGLYFKCFKTFNRWASSWSPQIHLGPKGPKAQNSKGNSTGQQGKEGKAIHRDRKSHHSSHRTTHLITQKGNSTWLMRKLREKIKGKKGK